MVAQVKAGYKQTQIGIIPEDWEIGKLTNYISLKHGFQFRDEHFSKDGYIVVKIGNLKDGMGLNIIKPSYIPKSTMDQFKNFTLHKGDVLMALTGATLGKVSFVDSDDVLYQNYRVGNFIVDAKSIKKYIFYILQSSFIQSRIQGLVNEAAQPNLGKKDFDKFIVPFPNTINEQRKIAEALSDTDTLLESLNKLIEKKKIIKQGAMQELLTGKRRLPGFSDCWEEKGLGEFAEFFKGKGLPKSQISMHGEHKCIHYGELFTKYGTEVKQILSKTNNNKNSFLSKSNDVLMPTSDVTPSGLAKASAIIENDIILGGDILVIRISENVLKGIFLSLYIRNNKAKILQLVTGTTVYHIYASDLMKFVVRYPKNIEEQNAIIKVLSEMDGEIELLEKKRDKYKQIKQGMMQELLTGRIRLI